VTATAFLVVVAVVLYYYVVVARVGSASSKWLLDLVGSRFRVASRYSTDELDKMIKLVVVGGLQLVFCCGLVLLSGVAVSSLLPGHVRPALMLYGIPLGIGEAALGSFLGEIAMRTAVAVAPGSVPNEPRDWLAMLKGGWMSLFFRTAQSAPFAFLGGLLVLYVSIEEVVFRGVLMGALAPVGTVVAFSVSLVLFLSVQTFHMPSWPSTIFPVMGALVIGVVNGALYLSVHDLGPLIVAHGVFLLTALL
jgi:Type II CAAX prenyl endopeptidase Rce1-like